jgi:DNA polymerase III subunit epsilon
MLYLGPSALNPTPAVESITIDDWQQYYLQQAKVAEHKLLRDFYAKGMISAATAICDVPLLAMDIETTGLDPTLSDIVSIGLAPMSLKQVNSSQARQWLVKPRCGLNDRSVTLHGITHSDIDLAPDLADILPELLTALAGKVVVVHYRGIERPFLHAALKARLGAGVYFPVIDTMALEARLYRQQPVRWWQKWQRQPKVSIRLADSRQRYGLPHYRPHHAVTDAIACAELLQAQLATRFSPQTPVNQLWC